MSIRRRKPLAPVLELTPLVDVVFLLLTFYMLTSSFVREDILPLELPSSESASSTKLESISVSLLDDNSVYLSSELIPISSLAERLSMKATAETAVVVRAGKEGSVQALVSVLDQIKRAKIDNISLATEGE